MYCIVYSQVDTTSHSTQSPVSQAHIIYVYVLHLFLVLRSVIGVYAIIGGADEIVQSVVFCCQRQLPH